jgi:hypothetical protein
MLNLLWTLNAVPNCSLLWNLAAKKYHLRFQLGHPFLPDRLWDSVRSPACTPSAPKPLVVPIAVCLESLARDATLVILVGQSVPNETDRSRCRF